MSILLQEFMFVGAIQTAGSLLIGRFYEGLEVLVKYLCMSYTRQ